MTEQKTLIQLDTLDIKFSDRVFSGVSQHWYSSHWKITRGCGPATASNIFAYLASTKPLVKALYSKNSQTQADFLSLMEDVWQCLKPTLIGTYMSLFVRGGLLYGASKGVALKANTLKIPFWNKRKHLLEEIYNFVANSIDRGFPLGFLNFGNGHLNNLSSWHWVTVVGIFKNHKNEVYLNIFDNGIKKDINLSFWLNSTFLGGGLVSFSY